MPHTQQKPDCRGWVFAVFAKIPPPFAHTRGHIRSAYLMRGRSICSDVACRVAVRHLALNAGEWYRNGPINGARVPP